MTLKELAEKLDGTTEYPSMPKDIVKMAEESGIVIVHGCSDDLIEFEGAIRDEAGCFDGGKVYFNKSGFIEEGSKAERFIKVFWDGQCEDEKRHFEATWEYETDIPHETFRMYSEEELYCKGMVFYLKDIDVMSECDYCIHVEMCGWRKSLEDRGCDFFDEGNNWIPVKERLPEENDYKSCYEVADGAVLWTNEDGLVGMGYYYESTKRWSDINDCPISVIAWMPLPEPYREDGE